MITGFNTDIEYQGITYHVQTEDKGVKTPLILSLVYNRGTILASKRSAYDDLLIGDFNENELSERLQKQHKLICAAVRAGRIEELKRMAANDSAAKVKASAVEKEIELPMVGKSLVEKEPANNDVKAAKREIPAPVVHPEKNKSVSPPSIKKTAPDSTENSFADGDGLFPKAKDELIWDVPISVLEEPIIEAVQVIEELILSDEAVEILTEYAGDEQVFNSKLKIRLLTEEKFKSGDRKTLCVAVKRGNSAKGLSGAQVIVKILGSSFRPLIFHAKTDDNGIATVHLQMPQFKSGRAALLIKAINEGEEVELRRAVQQN